MAFACVTNRRYVFHSGTRDAAGIVKEILYFFGCRLATGIVDWGFMYITVDILGFSDVYMKIVANVIVVILKDQKEERNNKTYKVRITVKKFSSPVKSFKIGKVDYTAKLKKGIAAEIKLKKKKGKININIVPGKGWKVSKIQYEASYYGDDEDYYNKDVSKTYKNKDVITFKKNDDYVECLYFTLTQKSTGIKLEYEIFLQ